MLWSEHRVRALLEYMGEVYHRGDHGRSESVYLEGVGRTAYDVGAGVYVCGVGAGSVCVLLLGAEVSGEESDGGETMRISAEGASKVVESQQGVSFQWFVWHLGLASLLSRVLHDHNEWRKGRRVGSDTLHFAFFLPHVMKL